MRRSITKLVLAQQAGMLCKQIVNNPCRTPDSPIRYMLVTNAARLSQLRLDAGNRTTNQDYVIELQLFSLPGHRTQVSNYSLSSLASRVIGGHGFGPGGINPQSSSLHYRQIAEISILRWCWTGPRLRKLTGHQAGPQYCTGRSITGGKPDFPVRWRYQQHEIYNCA